MSRTLEPRPGPGGAGAEPRGHTDFHWACPDQAPSVVSLLPNVAEGEIEAVDLTEPALLLGAFAAGAQVGFELIESGQHLRVDLQHGAADAGVLMRTRGAVGAGAATELDLALVEVLLELGPLLVGRRAVLLGRPELAAVVEELLVVTYDVVVEDRDVAAS
ncbi:hypothetical protein K1T35_35100 [Pseudonocardia sp. DSM 110487]|uniref:hypothetical protein n=1 Tax=Pseudonocardia sp. DSM 110487 TaxID=2865833 RepID=UPI001C699C8D|nr:hypothetical protein [Pseudonocardia sp. DSM 110487]QYN33669.1 hypothetical protein K1T35_35100 [Pseudonocardia sp. DSM 110487]